MSTVEDLNHTNQFKPSTCMSTTYICVSFCRLQFCCYSLAFSKGVVDVFVVGNIVDHSSFFIQHSC